MAILSGFAAMYAAMVMMVVVEYALMSVFEA